MLLVCVYWYTSLFAGRSGCGFYPTSLQPFMITVFDTHIYKSSWHCGYDSRCLCWADKWHHAPWCVCLRELLQANCQHRGRGDGSFVCVCTEHVWRSAWEQCWSATHWHVSQLIYINQGRSAPTNHSTVLIRGPRAWHCCSSSVPRCLSRPDRCRHVNELHA